MKVRSLKLKEAHKNSNGTESFCSILWDIEAQHLITSSSSDSSISIHDFTNPSISPKILRHHKEGVTAIALSPDSTCLASGSVDRSVKLYRFPGGEFQTNVTRFTLPIRALAFNKSGSMLAAAGDDEGIKLIKTVDGSVDRILKGHRGSVTSLAFDPKGEYLSSVDSLGNLVFWKLSTGKILHNLEAVAPDTGSDMIPLSVVSWSPDGDILAVPGLNGEVVGYDRDTAEVEFTLKGQHEKSVCFVSWSPNGKYIATSGLDKQILIWDVKKKDDIYRQKFDDRITYMSWKPNGNAIAVIDVMGKYGVWESPVPSSMKSPTEDAPCLKLKSNVPLFDDDDDEQEPSNSGFLSNADEDSFGESEPVSRKNSFSESEPVSRKRLRKQSKYDNMLDEDSDDQLGLLPEVEPRRKVPRSVKKDSENTNEKFQSVDKPSRLKMQEAFQPGSTPVQLGGKRFLCYNMLGSITTIEKDGSSHIEVDFHDTGKGPRVPSMTDYFGFTMASLNESGSVFANPCKGEKNMSTLMYRPFSSWANNSEWSMRFEAEEVKVVALGAGWIAAVTSRNFLRIYTEGGLQRYVLSLDGPVVTAAGFKNELAVVFHSSHSLPSNDQMLEFKVFNISNETQPLRGPVPLSPGSCLSWFGFTEEGQLSTYDSEGILRVFTSQYGGSWIPLFSANKEKKSDESYWVVGLNASNVFCIVCKSPDLYPQVTPKPVLTLVSLSFPLASSDLGADDLENEFILSNLYLSQAKKKVEELAFSGLDTSSEDDKAFTLEASLDRCILRLIAACCNADKLVRATELVRLLSLEKSVKGAIKLVTAMKLPVLAERFSIILEERMLNETMEATTPNPIPKSVAANGFEAAQSKLAEHKALEPESASTSLKFSSPQFSKQGKTEENSALGGKKIELHRTPVEGKKKDEVSHASLSRTIDPSPKPLKSQQKPTQQNMMNKSTNENGNGASQVDRPSNPFVKTPASQKASLFDTIKKAKRQS